MTTKALDTLATTELTVCNEATGCRYAVAIPLPKGEILSRLRRAIPPPYFESVDFRTFVFIIADATRLELHVVGSDEEESVAELNRILAALRRATL